LADSRARARGKFLVVGSEKFYVRGVTYGTFRPGEHGDFPSPEIVASDFRAMYAAGINTIRTYTPPTNWLLERCALGKHPRERNPGLRGALTGARVNDEGEWR
jgi:hypothetical protein